MLAAARRGAHVAGVDMDPLRVEQSRVLLRQAGYEADVVLGDVMDVDITADVVFAFLTPATVQRLATRLGRLPAGTRVVLVDVDVEGWEAERAGSGCFLYRTPIRPRKRTYSTGWAGEGMLAVLPPEVTSVTSISVTPPAGRVALELRGGLKGATRVACGFQAIDSARPVVVDVEWPPRPGGTVIAGELECAGAGSLVVFGLYDGGPSSVRILTREECGLVAERLRDDDVRRR